MMKARRRSNFILSVSTNKGRVKGVEEVKFPVKSYFETRFEEPIRVRHVLDGVDFMKLSSEESSILK